MYRGREGACTLSLRLVLADTTHYPLTQYTEPSYKHLQPRTHQHPTALRTSHAHETPHISCTEEIAAENTLGGGPLGLAPGMHGRAGGEGGGGRGGSASSLSGILQQQLAANGGAQVVAPPAAPHSLYGSDGAPPVMETWGQWTQTDDEVEAKLIVPGNTTSKVCKIRFQRSTLSVVVGGEVLVEGRLFGAVVPDECTYTMEPLGARKELCVTLTKADEGTTWSFFTAANVQS